MSFRYRMFYATSPYLIDRAASLGMNWAVVHSYGIEGERPHPESGRSMDMCPIYFEDYPRVAEPRHYSDAVWLEPLRREVASLCRRAKAQGLKVAFHFYEPTLPFIFEREYPEIVGVWRMPTQEGAVDIHSHLDPDKEETWELIRSKYAEMARDFPGLDMIILSTWDGHGSRWCIPEAGMPIHRRLSRMVEAAREGVRSVREDCTVCFRLWGRNWPSEMYRDSHRLIAEVTGVENAGDLMNPITKPHNDPAEVLPRVFEELPPDVPLMYKSTRVDIADGQPMIDVFGDYPQDRDQIIEVSYERYHQKPWPWCKIKHIRKGLDAAKKNKLAGFLALATNMGDLRRDVDPEKGNLGRMNTWLLERLLDGDKRTDEELVAAWLEGEFGSPQPKEAVDVLLEADDIADKGVQWGGGVPSRQPFASPHSTKLYWFFDGFIDAEFPYRMAEPTLDTISQLIRMKERAHERARANIEKIKSARAQMSPELYGELIDGYTTFADYILLCRDWHSHILTQYAIECGLYRSDRLTLGKMSRYSESFIRNLCRLKDAEAGKMAIRRLSFPDPFPLT